ncbi:MAG: penicillin-binding protein 2 [Gammaproteobacteria bacterium]|nr:penicillin-binding protein 2 [Gammaproteobacteria bacterium]
MADDALTITPWRRKFVAICLIALPVVVAGRALVLQTERSDKLTNAGHDRYTRQFDLQARRGMIFDRNNEPLAVSARVYHVFADPGVLQWADEKHAGNESENKSKVAQILGLTVAELDNMIANSTSPRYTVVARQVRPAQWAAIRELSRAQGVRGFGVEHKERRYYPAAEVMSPVLGFTDVDGKGIAGLEQTVNTALSGQSGKVVQIAIGSRDTKVFEPVHMSKARKDGENLGLTIDLRLQHVAYRELKKHALRHKAQSASLVAVDVSTGEVLSMATWPADNPNDPEMKTKGVIVNRPALTTFEPGSTIKPFTILNALESGVYNANTMVKTSPGILRVDEFKVRDTKNYGDLTLEGILQKSSNVGAAKIAIALGPEAVWSMLDRFGFGKSSGLNLPFESAGRLRDWNNWYRADLMAAGYGYGLSVTLLQLANGYAGLANGGVSTPPLLVKGALRSPRRAVADPKLSAQVVQMMRSVVVEGGTGTRAAVLGYSVAGKTGTSLKQINGEYRTGVYQSLFAGVIPATQPKLAIAVLVDEPASGEYYGGLVAAPVFSSFATEAMRLLNVTPDLPEQIEQMREKEREALEALEEEPGNE